MVRFTSHLVLTKLFLRTNNKVCILHTVYSVYVCVLSMRMRISFAIIIAQGIIFAGAAISTSSSKSRAQRCHFLERKLYS